MKNPVYKLLLPLALSLFTSNLLFSQNFTVKIDGTPFLCQGDCGELIAIVSPAVPQTAYTYAWTGPGGFASTTQLLTVCMPGTYTVTVVSSNGTTATASYAVQYLSSTPIGIYSQNPSPCKDSLISSGSACERVCPFSTVTYYGLDLTGNTTTVFDWSVTGALSYTIDNQQQTISVTWGPPGSGTILVFGANSQCQGQGSHCVTIIEEPKAKFDAIPAAQAGTVKICKGQTVYFQNQSEGADFFDWDFGNGISSENAHPQVAYNSPGTYTVRLVARSACVCSDTTELQIEVLDAQTPMLDCTGTVCAGETVTYTSSMTCSAYGWSVSPNGQVVAGGSPGDNSITVKWLDGPAGYLNLDVSSCAGAVCSQPAIVQIPVMADNAEIRGEPRVCPNTTETYSIEPAYGGGTNYTWKLSSGGFIKEGQGTSRIVVEWSNAANANATHWISVVYDNCFLGCNGQDSLAVKILPPFAISGPVEICEGASGSFSSKFTNNGFAFAVNWTLNDPTGATISSLSNLANANLNFTAGPGGYTIYATPGDPSKTCTDKSEWRATVKPKPAKPTGIVGEREVCPGKNYVYEAQGINPLHNASWRWNDGSVVLFTNIGPHKLLRSWSANPPRWLAVAAQTTDGLACLSDTTKIFIDPLPPIFVNGKPSACSGEREKYTATVLQGLDYQWEIVPADAGTFTGASNTTEVEIFWQKPGNHTLRVTVCGKIASRNVAVFAPPQPMVTAPAGLCPGQQGLVQATASFNTYSWKTETGVPVGSAPAVNLFPGKYQLVVTDVNGCKGSDEFSIDEYPRPNVSVSTPDPTGFCANSRFVKMSALVNGEGNFTYDWLRDGVSLGIGGSTYTTNQYGKYSIVVANEYGCTAQDGPIEVFEFCNGGVCHNPGHPKCPPGTIEMVIDPQPNCQDFVFRNVSGPAYQAGTTRWHFGESGATYLGTSTDEITNFHFPNAGHFIVVLYAQTTAGAFCIDLDSVRVRAVAKFKEIPACPGELTDFEDLTTFLPSESITSYAWDFGDPASGASNVSAAKDPKHIYASPGTYTVSLTVTTASGCTSSFSKNIKIDDLPSVSIAPLPIKCVGTPLEFSAITTESKIEWDFGDPASGGLNTASVGSAFHKFATAGNYTVAVTATSAIGCKSTYSIVIPVVANTLTGTASAAPASPICEGYNTTLTAQSPSAVSYKWSNGMTIPQFITGVIGEYRVTMTDSEGCTFVPPVVPISQMPAPDGIIKALLKNENGAVAGVAYPNLTICQGEDVFLQGYGTGVASWKWSNNATSSGIEFSEDRFNLLPVGTYQYTATVTSFNGCTAVTDPFNVHVNPRPTGFSIGASGFPHCSGEATTLNYTGPQPANWQIFWNTGDAGPSYTTQSPGEFFVRVINEFGCSNESNRITVFEGPNLGSIPSGCHTKCRPETLCFPAQPSITSWQWMLDGAPIPGATTPTLTATQSGSYTLQMTDFQGCTAESDPLVLDLYDGYGSIFGKVWSDVNGNGMIDPGVDTVMSNIKILLAQNGSPVGTAESNFDGNFAFPNILSVGYEVEVDPASVPSGWHVVIGKSNLTLVGCDDVETTGFLLSFNCAPQNSTVKMTACTGDFATFNGQQIPAGGSQIFNFTTALGCDSTVTVEVGEAFPVFENVKLKACVGDFATFDGQQIAAGTTKIFNFKTSAGCDSTITVEVEAVPGFAEFVKLTACTGGFATFNGQQIPVGGIRIFNFTSLGGCDSTVYVQVGEVFPSFENVKLKACAGEFATFNGQQIPAGATQVFKFQTVAGCDSTITVEVEELQKFSQTIKMTACAGEFATFNGQQIPAGATQVFNFQTVAGCDSTVRVEVEALPNFSKMVKMKACTGGFATFNGQQIPAGGFQIFNLQTVAGCDSTIRVDVEEVSKFSENVKLRACTGEFATFNGQQIAAGATEVFNFISAGGCDSTVTVEVVEAFPSFENVKLKACAGDFATFDGQQIAAGATQVFNFQTVAGCDSTVRVEVEALPNFSQTVKLKACAGDFATFNGQQIAAGASKIFNFQTFAGCDSTVTVEVEELQIFSEKVKMAACAGKFATFNGQQIAAGATQVFNFQTVAGCDSTVTVEVEELEKFSQTVKLKACTGSFATFNGQPIAAGATQIFSFQTTSGCDSTVTVEVEEVQNFFENKKLSACAGSFTVFNGQQIAAGASQTFQFTSVGGCDSTVVVDVAEIATTSGSKTLKACLGDFATFGGVQIPAGGSQNFTLISAAGCDSVLTVTVVELPVKFTDLQATVCPGEVHIYNGVEIAAGESKDFHLLTNEGCDSTVTVTVSAHPAATFDLAAKNACPNASDGELRALNAAGGLAPFQFSLDGGVFGSDSVFAGLAPGLHRLALLDANGCVFEKDTALASFEALRVSLENAVLPCDSSGVWLTPAIEGHAAGMSFEWSNGEKVPAIKVFEPGPMWFEVKNECELTRRDFEVVWSDSTGVNSFVYVPNAFCPEAREAGNEMFRSFPATGLRVLRYRLDVYDRWGERVFTSLEPEEGWLGPLRDRKMGPAVFVWALEMDVAICGRVISVKRKGDVAVVR